MKTLTLKMKTVLILCLGLTFLFTTTSCKKEKGCTDVTATNFDVDAEKDDGSCIYLSDRITGEWDAQRFFIDGDDLVAQGFFNSIRFEFEADGDFEWNAIPSNGDPFFGQGEWQVDGDFIEIEFDSGADTFCSDAEHRFTVDFDGDDEVNLEDNCNDGTVLKIELDKN